MAKHINEIKTTYGVKLAPLNASFYDPESGCNLFIRTPYYFFNHQPTKQIISAVKNGQLIDLKGNILNPTAATQTTAKTADADVQDDQETPKSKSKSKAKEQ